MLATMTRRHRPSAALVLGLLSGTLAAITVLPTIVPLTWRVIETEDAALVRQAESAARAVLTISDGRSPTMPDLSARLMVDGLALIDRSGNITWTDGTVPAVGWAATGCPRPDDQGRYAHVEGTRWTFGCAEQGELTAIAGVRQTTDSTAFVGWLVAGLSLMVGISTALGVLQVLQPLSAVTAAVQRLGAGERGVRLSTTGLTELDDLVDRLNAATQAMEDREDAILSRIELVQHLARVVAHEIRNPLQSLELIASNIAEEEERSERDALARSIQAEVRTLENVVVRMLREAPGQAALRPNRVSTTTTDLINQVLAFRRFEARRKNIELTAGALMDVTIAVDRALVSRALENLVTNAMQAIGDKGGHIVLSAWADPDHVHIAVDDDGPGVSEDLAHTIYQANVTSRKDGHGLGLSLVSGVMQAHEGYVDHGRSPLGGARFVCHLPLVAEARKEP